MVVGLTQAGVARRLKVSAPYIASVEAGRENLTIGQLAGIASALGVVLDITLALPDRGDESALRADDSIALLPGIGVTEAAEVPVP